MIILEDGGGLRFMWNPDFVSVACLCRALAHVKKSLTTHIISQEAPTSSERASLGRN